ncbi:MAG TPA: hypothetical protein VK466_15920, partial [Terriglobales bacterium]|nr:hypothetical protein [Terriglobales bacterium]
GNNQAQPGHSERIRPQKHAESWTPERSPASEQGSDIGRPEPQLSAVPTANAQTLNRARPLARRARITARPPRVRIRTRNP